MKPKRQPVTRIDCCQYLLFSQINYTLTNFADHTEHFSLDAVNRYLARDQAPPTLDVEERASPSGAGARR